MSIHFRLRLLLKMMVCLFFFLLQIFFVLLGVVVGTQVSQPSVAPRMPCVAWMLSKVSK